MSSSHTKMSAFRTPVSELFSILRNNPKLLEEKHPEMKKKLDAYCGKGQGLGNKCSDQEACFAVLCEANKWTLRPEDAEDGFFYTYQAQGTQKAIDFQLMYMEDGEVIESVNIDLKHSDKDAIFLNDGSFLENVVYVISFTRLLPRVKGQRACPREQVCVIARGQDVMTEKDRMALEKRFALLKELNTVKEDLDYLVLYARNANQFSCKRFSPEFTEDCFNKTQSWLGPSASPTEPEPHSPPA
jgi:hypothetical protein